MKEMAAAADNKVEELLAILDEDIRHIQDSMSRLNELRSSVIKRDDKALAELLSRHGAIVSGSDCVSSSATERLKNLGIQIATGHRTAFTSITGKIFEFGFSDSIIQMWAAFLYEMTEGRTLKRFAGCVTPEETALSHRLFTAALESHRTGSVVRV